jgi:hypothetical protein
MSKTSNICKNAGISSSKVMVNQLPQRKPFNYQVTIEEIPDQDTNQRGSPPLPPGEPIIVPVTVAEAANSERMDL